MTGQTRAWARFETWAARLSLAWLAALLPLMASPLAACDDLVPRPEAPPPLLPEPGDPTFPPDPNDPGPTTPRDDDPVTVRAIEPTEGPVEGGLDVMVTGTGFRDGLEVLFEETPAPEVFVISSTTAIVRLPPHPAGRFDVTVLHPRASGEPATLYGAFRYFQAMSIAAVEPAEGPEDGGSLVSVFGKGFTADTRVFLDGRPLLDQRVIDGETVRGQAPAGRFGRVDVHAVGFNGTAFLADGYAYLAAPELTHLTPVAGRAGTRVVLSGRGLGDDAEVFFGEAPATLVRAARDGTNLEVLAPAPPAGEDLAVVDVRVQTRAGVSVLDRAFAYRGDADPLVLACSHLVPASGPAAGGTEVELACLGLAYGGLEVRFGEALAELVDVDVDGGRLVVTSPPGTGRQPVTVRSAAAAPVSAGTFDFRDISPLGLDAVSPASGPTSGGTTIELRGRGFAPGLAVTVGGFAATGVEVLAPDRLVARTPPGVPGLADVVVRASGLEARLADSFDYGSDRLRLDLVAPSRAARSGGTWLYIHGEGFTDATTVSIGGVPCERIARVSSAELHVRSPKLAVGVHDALVEDGGRTSSLERALTTFDPRSGTGGTWGPPIDGTLNVTVWGSGGYGPVAGAFVIVGRDPRSPWRGYTDENGQVTISGPGLVGPVEVTASRDGFTAYSVLVFDAENVTLLLQQNPTPPPSQGSGNNNPPTPPPNAILRGKVVGFDKYVVAPPGSCAAVQIPETQHCAPCEPTEPDGGCGGAEGFACLGLASVGGGVSSNHCVAACTQDTECPTGYACGATASGARCLPSAGVKRAYCNVSSTSLFGYEYPIQERGWVDALGQFELDSRRLGELAIYCFGGYQDTQGMFTPTVMGVKRHLFAMPGAVMDDLEIELAYPLRRSFRLRLEEPPTSSTGLNPPSVVISLDLGPDGVIPFSRALVAVGEPDDHLWVAPNQLAALSGDVYDAHYLLYTTLAPAGVGGYQPRSYNLVQHVQSIVEDRFPVRDEGGWRLEGSQVAVDLNGLWGASDAEGTRLWAVGEDGRILLFSGSSWSGQTSGTIEDLHAIDGLSGRDAWAVGAAGTVRHWDGVAWRPVEAPFDEYVAVHVEPTRVYAAGRVRLRVYDRETGLWSLAGAPAVQEVRGFVRGPELIALGTGGRLFVPDAAGAWRTLATPATSTLRAGLRRADGTLVVIGDGGVVLAGSSPDALTRVEVATTRDLTALTEEADGTLVIVGDHGLALRGKELGSLWLETIPDYRSKAGGVWAMPDGATRVVGSAAFILGPFLHFPIITAPLHEASLDALAFGWTWTGPPNQYTRLALTPEASITVWTMIVDGAEQSAVLPDLSEAAGLNPLLPGRYRFEVLRVLNRNFDIDGFSTRDFNLYARDSWSTNEAWFFQP